MSTLTRSLTIFALASAILAGCASQAPRETTANGDESYVDNESISLNDNKSITAMSEKYITRLPPKSQSNVIIQSGRMDPFAGNEAPLTAVPVVVAQTSGFGDNFRITSFAKAKGQISITVIYNNNSGIVLAGETGGESTNLLPNGWKLSSIDPRNGIVNLINHTTNQSISYQL